MQTVLIKSVLFTCFIICLSIYNNSYVSIDKEEELVAKKIQVKKIVRLSPNPSFDGNVVIESFVPDAISFYLFDKDANLIRQVNLKGNSRFAIQDLQKGSYMYDVFLSEESIENGNIQVK
jgi:hypothetical protein